MSSTLWAVFVSGEGSNLQNFLDLERSGQLKNQKIAAVFADRECKAIQRAQSEAKPTFVCSPKENQHTEKLLQFLETHRVDRIFLLGYMRLLKSDFLKAWNKPIINLHPSWLPKYPGLDSVKRAIEAGDPFIGVTLHEVIEEVDAGPILRQLSFPYDRSASFEQVMERVHEFERKIVRDYLFDLDLQAQSNVSS